MTGAKCFRCGQNYGSNDPDDIEGDGRCPKCEEVGKRAAAETDKKIAAMRLANPDRFHNPNSEIIKNLIEKGGRINARDLGITPRD